MTTCELIIKPITRMVEEENKSLDEIAAEVCPKVKHGREKIIRVIKDFISEEYLVTHAIVLGYDVGKADLAKKRNFKAHKKIDARGESDCCAIQSVGEACDNATRCCSEGGQENSNGSVSGNVLAAVRNLIEIFGINRVLEAIEAIVSETPKDAIEKISSGTKFPINPEGSPGESWAPASHN